MGVNIGTGGNTDRLRSGNNTNPQFGDPGTVFCRFKPGWNYNDGVGHMIYSFGGQHGGFPSLGDWQFLKWSDSNIYIGFFNPGSDQRLTVTTSSLFASGVWNNWSVTYNTSGPLTELFRDGSSVGSLSSQPSGIPTFDVFGDNNDRTNFGNGGDDQAGSFTATGVIADVARWNRVLTADEQVALGKGFAPTCFPNGLLAHYPLINVTDINSKLIDTTGPSMTGSDGTVVSAEHGRVFYPG